MVKGNIKIKECDLNLKESKELLDMIYEYNDELEIEFSLSLCEITDMFKYYVSRNIETIGNLDDYDCIYPEFKFDNNELKFTLNINDDEDDEPEIRLLNKELKKHFGNSLIDTKAENIFKILLIDSCLYYLNDDILILNMYYDNYKDTWLGKYLANLEQ